MYSIFDDPNMGELVDEINSDESQEDLNVEKLYKHTMRSIIYMIQKRCSYHDLLEAFNEIGIAEPSFWLTALKEIISTYSLNSLKIFLSPGFKIDLDIEKDIRDLVLFLKGTLIRQIESKELNINLLKDIEEFKSIVFNIENCPKLLKTAITYIDTVSYNKFIKTLNEESKTPIQ